MDEAAVLRSVEDAVLRQEDHSIDVLCHAIHTEPSAPLVGRGRASECAHHFLLSRHSLASSLATSLGATFPVA